MIILHFTNVITMYTIIWNVIWKYSHYKINTSDLNNEILKVWRRLAKNFNYNIDHWSTEMYKNTEKICT